MLMALMIFVYRWRFVQPKSLTDWVLRGRTCSAPRRSWMFDLVRMLFGGGIDAVRQLWPFGFRGGLD
jgi:hypothetical protein